MTIEVRRMTVDQFEAFADTPENADRLLELVDGQIADKSLSEFQGVIVLNTGSALHQFITSHSLGRVGVEIRHRNPDDAYNARIPDISFTSKARLSDVVTRGSVPQLPDLAVEVKSSDDSYLQMRAKAAWFMAHGTRMVWLVYPEKRLVEVFHRDENGVESIDIFTSGESVDGLDVLPGFALPLDVIFRTG